MTTTPSWGTDFAAFEATAKSHHDIIFDAIRKHQHPAAFLPNFGLFTTVVTNVGEISYKKALLFAQQQNNPLYQYADMVVIAMACEDDFCRSTLTSVPTTRQQRLNMTAWGNLAYLAQYASTAEVREQYEKFFQSQTKE